MTRTKPLFQAEITDADEILVAIVTRRRSDDLDYVSIARHDDLITIDVKQVPELMRLLLKAMNT